MRVGHIAEARAIPVSARAHESPAARARSSRSRTDASTAAPSASCPRPAGGSRSQEPDGGGRAGARRSSSEGYREVTLTGVDIGHYGWDLDAADEPRRAHQPARRGERACAGSGCPRCCPPTSSPELIEAVVIGCLPSSPICTCRSRAEAIACSGSCAVRTMSRMYRALVEQLAAAIPDLGLGTDVIVGHPGESDDDFEATMTLVEELPLSYLHVFAYSDRKGTEAAAMGDRVASPDDPRAEPRLRALGAEKSVAFRRDAGGAAAEAVLVADRGQGERPHRQLRRGALRGPAGSASKLCPSPGRRTRMPGSHARRVEEAA